MKKTYLTPNIQLKYLEKQDVLYLSNVSDNQNDFFEIKGGNLQ